MSFKFFKENKSTNLDESVIRFVRTINVAVICRNIPDFQEWKRTIIGVTNSNFFEGVNHLDCFSRYENGIVYCYYAINNLHSLTGRHFNDIRIVSNVDMNDPIVISIMDRLTYLF